jgi:hypothetical protein
MPSLWLIVDWLPISRHPSSRRRLVVVVVILSSCRCLVVVVVVIWGALSLSGVLTSGGALSGGSSGSVVIRECPHQGWKEAVLELDKTELSAENTMVGL